MPARPLRRVDRSRLVPILAALALLAGVGAACQDAAKIHEDGAQAGGGLAGWTPADPPAIPGAMAPSLTPAPDGLLLTWLEPAPVKAGSGPEARAHALRVSRFSLHGDNGDGRWSSPVTIAAGDDFFANWADFPAVAVAPDGSLTAHWLAKIGSGDYAYGIFLARSTDGGATWKPAGLLHSDRLPTEHGFVSWIPEGQGLRAVWLDGREMLKEGPMTLRTGLAGKPESEELLDGRVCECCQTDVALAADGPIVAYRDRSDQEVRDMYVVRKTASGWSQPAPVHRDEWQIPGCPVNGPAIAAAGKRVAVAWFTAGSTTEPRPRVQLAFSEDGGKSFGQPVLIDGEKPPGRVDLQLDPKGDAIVSWLGRPDGGQGESAAVRLRRVSPRGKVGPPVTVAATSAARSSGFPRTALVGDRLWLAWVENAPDQGGASRVRAGSLPLAAVP